MKINARNYEEVKAWAERGNPLEYKFERKIGMKVQIKGRPDRSETIVGFGKIITEVDFGDGIYPEVATTIEPYCQSGQLMMDI